MELNRKECDLIWTALEEYVERYADGIPEDRRAAKKCQQLLRRIGDEGWGDWLIGETDTLAAALIVVQATGDTAWKMDGSWSARRRGKRAMKLLEKLDAEEDRRADLELD